MDFFTAGSLMDVIQTIGLAGIIGIIFAETGLFIGFFLPGDSLLFTAGILASQGVFNISILTAGFFAASIAGNLTGYYFGKRIGPKLFSKKDSLFFHHEHLERTRRFFTHHGGKTIILARFIPIIRTFAPILAGVGGMEYRHFVIHSVIGGFLWAVLLTMAGFVLGNAVPDIDRYLLPIIGTIIILSFVPALVHSRKH